MLTSDPGVVDEPGEQPASAAPHPPERRHRVARVVGAVGRLMITSGVVVLLFVAYQVWGTNLHTARAQDDLAEEFDALVGEAPGTDPAPTAPATPPAPTDPSAPATDPPTPAPAVAPPGAGEVVGSFTIPAIGRTTPYYVVEGTGVDQLKRGAAHYPGTPLPGQAGNAAVAGHRTTYGAPLHDVDDLVAGDEIHFTTAQGEFTYEVREVFVVEPHEVEVIGPQDATPEDPLGRDMLTFTACHPKFSAAERIIVHADLVGRPVPPLDGQQEAAERVLAETGTTPGAIDDFATEPALRFPGALWGLLAIAVWALTRALAVAARRTGRVPWVVPYLVGTPLCLLVLFLFFENVSYEGVARSLGLSV